MGMASKRAGGAILLCLVIAVTVYVFLGGSPSIALDFREDGFTASVADYDVNIPYEQIVSLELIDIPELGSPEGGGEQRGFRYGVWRNEIWGSYAQCTTKQAGVCILIERNDGGPFLLSIEGDASTRELHAMLIGLLHSKGHCLGMTNDTFGYLIIAYRGLTTAPMNRQVVTVPVVLTEFTRGKLPTEQKGRDS